MEENEPYLNDKTQSLYKIYHTEYGCYVRRYQNFLSNWMSIVLIYDFSLNAHYLNKICQGNHLKESNSCLEKKVKHSW